VLGMNAADGTALGDLDHLKQSIRDILSTPIGSRVMRRDYGSRLFQLIDRPFGPDLLVDIYVAVADALDRWEPRLKLTRIRAAGAEPGRIEIALEGLYLPQGKPIKLDGIVVG